MESNVNLESIHNPSAFDVIDLLKSYFQRSIAIINFCLNGGSDAIRGVDNPNSIQSDQSFPGFGLALVALPLGFLLGIVINYVMLELEKSSVKWKESVVIG